MSCIPRCHGEPMLKSTVLYITLCLLNMSVLHTVIGRSLYLLCKSSEKNQPDCRKKMSFFNANCRSMWKLSDRNHNKKRAPRCLNALKRVTMWFSLCVMFSRRGGTPSDVDVIKLAATPRRGQAKGWEGGSGVRGQIVPGLELPQSSPPPPCVPVVGTLAAHDLLFSLMSSSGRRL